ncbi:ABC transporter permease [Allorhizocola rhizosphaerae]|uniref:ABC transporter permease n=1 Tax=Allorhizocola rhizosphaerae TaxID=1872709 RepID=UPI000E3E213D|nr:ABC transporter permease [Allorhizocola rhizosphaerae]
MSSQAGNPWFSWDYIRENTDTLLAALREHILLTVASVAIAALIAIPLSILAYRKNWLTGPILATAGTLYTIPSLALFAFLAPFTGLNPGTVLIGLVLYALLVILRGSLTGLRTVPAEIREVASGMGYGKLAMLWRVELPLALPSIMTGLRIATVSTVALLTVGEIVGFGGFGNLIIGGFRNNFYRAQIMTATLACVALALVLDALLALTGRALMPWTRRRSQ